MASRLKTMILKVGDRVKIVNHNAGVGGHSIGSVGIIQSKVINSDNKYWNIKVEGQPYCLYNATEAQPNNKLLVKFKFYGKSKR